MIDYKIMVITLLSSMLPGSKDTCGSSLNHGLLHAEVVVKVVIHEYIGGRLPTSRIVTITDAFAGSLHS